MLGSKHSRNILSNDITTLDGITLASSTKVRKTKNQGLPFSTFVTIDMEKFAHAMRLSG